MITRAAGTIVVVGLLVVGLGVSFPSSAPAIDANHDFESGLANWAATGTAFQNQPVEGNTVTTDRVLTRMQWDAGGIGGDYWKGLMYPIGIRNTHWIGTYENGAGDAPTGTLTSAPFKAQKRYLHFLLGGGKDIANLHVELQVLLADYETAWNVGRQGLYGVTSDGYTRVDRITPSVPSEELFRYWFDLAAELDNQYLDKTIRVCIVDNSSGAWGHINVDDFQQSESIAHFVPVDRPGYTLYADADKPLWGFVDTHAHPTHQVGFGGKVIVGDTGNDLSSLSGQNCDNIHGLPSHDDVFLMNAFILNADPHRADGYPDFAGFPKFNVKTHQQQHISWIKRAWQGGLRLFLALGVNNQFLASRALGVGNDGKPIDDESVVYRELDLFKRIVAANSDWMEIALTPADARRIILNGKLAVVLGVEMDSFGNFKDGQYCWKDDVPGKPMVCLDGNNVQQLIDGKVREYFEYGVRHVTPLHYISGVFGGAAVFRGETQLVAWAYRDFTNVAPGMSRGIGYSLYEDFPLGAALTGSAHSYITYCERIHQVPAGSGEVSQINADGLTNFGKILMKSLMKMGMLIDMEHMGCLSKDDLLEMGAKPQYPIVSSHTDPRELSFTSNPVRRFSGSDDEKYRDFGTTSIRFVRHEAQVSDTDMQGIRRLGGTVGPIMLPYRKSKYSGPWGDVANDCDGSSKTWAQMYMYCLDKMGGVGVGLSTDRGMVDFIGPRFGVNGAYSLKDEKPDWLRSGRRREQRLAQSNGVRYDRPFASYKPLIFEYGDVETWEEDVWKALAVWSAGVDAWTQENLVSQSTEAGHWDRIKNYAKGLTARDRSQLMKPGIGTGDGPWEQAAMFCLVQGLDPTDPKVPLTDVYSAADLRDNVTRVYFQVKPIFQSWLNMNGNNEPLRRLRDGNRDWDVNLDGVAHYGMLPDFLQDLKNVGFTRQQMQPLLSSAEDYIKMWERAEAAKVRVSLLDAGGRRPHLPR